MIFLLDTHAFIWAVLDTSKLSQRVKGLLHDKNNEIFLSTVSFWEISLKVKLKKFSFDGVDAKSFPHYARETHFSIIPLREAEAISFCELPVKENHRDPFERMLIWQAITNGMTLISWDAFFGQYKIDGLKLAW